MKEQKILHVAIKAGKFWEADSRSVEVDIFADGWAVREMATPGPDGYVLFLMEREKPGRSSAGPLPI
jgi:hypothetical protein